MMADEPIRVEVPPETPRMRQPDPGEVLRTINGRVASVSDMGGGHILGHAGDLYVSVVYDQPSKAIGWWVKAEHAPRPGTPVEVWIVVPEGES